MWNRLSLSLDICIVSASGRRILKPSCTLCYIFLRMNAVIYEGRANTWGLLEMAKSRTCLDQADPMWTRIPSSTYVCKRSASGCQIASNSAPKVLRCCDVTKVRRYGMQASSLEICLAVDARFSDGGSNIGG